MSLPSVELHHPDLPLQALSEDLLVPDLPTVSSAFFSTSNPIAADAAAGRRYIFFDPKLRRSPFHLRPGHFALQRQFSPKPSLCPKQRVTTPPETFKLPSPSRMAKPDVVLEDNKYGNQKSIKEISTLTDREFKQLSGVVRDFILANLKECNTTPRKWKMPNWRILAAKFVENEGNGPRFWNKSRSGFTSSDHFAWPDDKNVIIFIAFNVIRFETAKSSAGFAKRKGDTDSANDQTPSKKAKPSIASSPAGAANKQLQTPQKKRSASEQASGDEGTEEDEIEDSASIDTEQPAVQDNQGIRQSEQPGEKAIPRASFTAVNQPNPSEKPFGEDLTFSMPSIDAKSYAESPSSSVVRPSRATSMTPSKGGEEKTHAMQRNGKLQEPSEELRDKFEADEQPHIDFSEFVHDLPSDAKVIDVNDPARAHQSVTKPSAQPEFEDGDCAVPVTPSVAADTEASFKHHASSIRRGPSATPTKPLESSRRAVFAVGYAGATKNLMLEFPIDTGFTYFLGRLMIVATGGLRVAMGNSRHCHVKVPGMQRGMEFDMHDALSSERLWSMTMVRVGQTVGADLNDAVIEVDFS